MGFVVRGDARIHYEVEGEPGGAPVFTLAPGGLRSQNDLWRKMPWNPRERLRDRHRVIGLDQRNAGASSAPISASDGWGTYAADQLAVLDHLGVERCHLLGMCIGGAFALGLLNAAPQRFCSAVLLQPVGLDENRDTFLKLFDAWAEDARAQHPEADDAAFASFRSNLWGRDFAFSVTREQVAACPTPLLVMMGNDEYHPQSVSREIARLAPNATLVERWKDEGSLGATDATIRAFLAAHAPLPRPARSRGPGAARRSGHRRGCRAPCLIYDSKLDAPVSRAAKLRVVGVDGPVDTIPLGDEAGRVDAALDEPPDDRPGAVLAKFAGVRLAGRGVALDGDLQKFTVG